MEEKLLFDFGEIPVETKPQSQVDADEYQSIVLKSEVKKDEYTNYIQDTFDLKVGDVSKVCIPNKLNIESFNKDWNIIKIGTLALFVVHLAVENLQYLNIWRNNTTHKLQALCLIGQNA